MAPMDTLADSYDYIVVGGGTSGPVAARRLAEGAPNARVLLAEAGPAEDIIHSQMALGWEGIHFTKYDWDYDTTAQKHANGRVIHIPRGKFLGGCSGFNGMLMIRGNRADYDQLVEEGNPGWGWNDMVPYFKKSETFHPAEWHKAASDFHGTDGPLHTEPHPLAPISESCLESFIAKGFEFKPDMFVTGEYEGVGHVTRTVHKGIRTTGADFVTGPSKPANLTVSPNTLVDRVVLEQRDGKWVAVGIEVRQGTSKPKIVKANKEIIISGGAYNSPVILMHSGIGPKSHLDQVGIQTKVDLPGVGGNLSDHLITFNFFSVKDPKMTNDHLLYPPGAIDVALKEWMEQKSGVMSRFPFGAFAFKRMDALMKDKPEWKNAKTHGNLDPIGQRPDQAHIEYFTTECYGGGPQHVDKPGEHDSAFAMITMLLGPQSRGTVRLQSSNPDDKPIIDHNYLATELDLAMLAEGTRLGHEIIMEGPTAKHIDAAWPKLRVHPKTDTEWKEYTKQQAGTCYHPAGTCKMAPSSDPEGVVDHRLRVRNVANLRVADVSILPVLNNGHTQAPAYAIGEKVADMVLQDA